MANLASTLTLKLTDGLSGPAKQAADSLKGLGLSAQQLNAAVKFDGLRQAQANFRQAATSFEAARVNVRKLAQDFAAADAPSKQMAKALEQARGQATTAAMVQQAPQAQALGRRIRSGAGRALGNIAPFPGPPILGATYKAVKAGAAIDSAKTSLRVAGIPDNEIARVTKIALEQQARYPQLAISEILDRY